ncbi:hypothetical protein [Nocardia sp. NPDC058705]|uniref:hypothetical protein n=1 Tax=Nocardia sp. NPDC058705 TaxID=3346609 RepID=UPI00368CA57F
MKGDISKMKVWPTPAFVKPGSGIAEQLALMARLVSGDVAGPDFARGWFGARSRSLREGERVRERFDRRLNEVFFVLEDSYAIDPDTWEEGDLTDEELVEFVRTILAEVNSL